MKINNLLVINRSYKKNLRMMKMIIQTSTKKTRIFIKMLNSKMDKFKIHIKKTACHKIC